MITHINLRTRRALIPIQPPHILLPAVETPVPVVPRARPLALGDLGADRRGECHAGVRKQRRRHRVDPQRRLPGVRHHHGDVFGRRARLGEVIGHLGRDLVGRVAAVGEDDVLARDAAVEGRGGELMAERECWSVCGGEDRGGVCGAEKEARNEGEVGEEGAPAGAPAAARTERWVHSDREVLPVCGSPEGKQTAVRCVCSGMLRE